MKDERMTLAALLEVVYDYLSEAAPYSFRLEAGGRFFILLGSDWWSPALTERYRPEFVYNFRWYGGSYGLDALGWYDLLRHATFEVKEEEGLSFDWPGEGVHKTVESPARYLALSLLSAQEHEPYVSGILEALLARFPTDLLPILLDALWFEYDRGQREESFESYLLTASRRDAPMVMRAWNLLDAHFIEEAPEDEPLCGMLRLLCQRPQEPRTLVQMLRLLSMHEDSAEHVSYGQAPIWYGRDWCDWSAVIRIQECFVPSVLAQGLACLPALQQGFQSRHASNRQLVVEALGALGRIEAMPVLLLGLRDEAEWVRLSTIESLGKLGASAREVIENLQEAMQHEKGPLREELAVVLAELQSDAIDSLRHQLEELLFL